MSLQPAKRRKRRKGQFICQFENCGKVFSRSDHLRRHQVNHSQIRLQCSFPGCEKFFTRIDVKKKHELTHLKIKSPQQFVPSNVVDPTSRVEKQLTGGKTSLLSSTNLLTKSGTSPHMNGSYIPLPIHGFSEEKTVPDNSGTIANTGPPLSCRNDVIPISLDNISRKEPGPLYSSGEELDHSNKGVTSVKGGVSMSRYEPPEKKEDTDGILPSLANYRTMESDLFKPIHSDDASKVYSDEMIAWMLSDIDNDSSNNISYLDQLKDILLPIHREDLVGLDTVPLLDEIFSLSPEFPNENFQTEINVGIWNDMVRYIPELKDHPDFTIPKIKWFLELYWALFHCQYPILHRPSFSTQEAPSLLLLSLIMMGASLTKKVTIPNHFQLHDPSKLSNIIAEPLRWLIFSCEQAKPPCNAWVIQSLIILESFEIISSSRALHERACIYSSTKIQLLRRSPILGGDPLKGHQSDTSGKKSLWNTWIQSEAMKRAALMSFHLDTIHAIVFGHPINIFASQLKLSLPCPDHIWEYKNVDRNTASFTVANTPLFLDALKCMLQGKPVDVDPFGRQIILSGLVNLVFQIDQSGSQWSNFGWKTREEEWKGVILMAITYWKTQLPNGNCCSNLPSIYDGYLTSFTQYPLVFSGDTTCKFPIYHAAQLYLRISHYDFIAFAGAPKRMNVPILPEDYITVAKRIDKWSKTISGKLCVLNSLILLCEMFLPPEYSVDALNHYYDPNKDLFLYRPNIIICSTLVLWTYAFHVYGPESKFRSENPPENLKSESVPAMENGRDYLCRIRAELTNRTGIPFSSLSSMNVTENSSAIRKYCDVLSQIEGLHHLVGLLRLIETSYIGCDWQLGREYAKLLGNCLKRSAGDPQVICTDMFDV